MSTIDNIATLTFDQLKEEITTSQMGAVPNTALVQRFPLWLRFADSISTNVDLGPGPLEPWFARANALLTRVSTLVRELGVAATDEDIEILRQILGLVGYIDIMPAVEDARDCIWRVQGARALTQWIEEQEDV